jgi:hypothetical protein
MKNGGNSLNQDQGRQPPTDCPEFAAEFPGTYMPNKVYKEGYSKNDASSMESFHLKKAIQGEQPCIQGT